MYVNKWLSLASGSVLQLVAGLAYTFSLYAPSIKTALDFSQPELEGLGSAILCGGLFAWVPGLVYDSLTDRHKLGPRLTALIGIFCHFAGYSAIWLIASGHMHAPYPVLIISGLVASSGLLWLDTAAIVTNMRSFPTERGSIAGILKTFLGLGASIATTVYGALFAPDGLDFLLFLATLPAALGLCALPMLNYVPHVEENEVTHDRRHLTTDRRLLVTCGIVAILLVYQMLTALLAGQTFAVMVGALALLAAAIIFMPLGTGGVVSKPSRMPVTSDSSQTDTSPLLTVAATVEGIQRRSTSSAVEDGQVETASAEEVSSTRKEAKANAPRELTLRQCLCSPDYWMLWSSLFIGIGSGFTFLNNLGQHVEALGAEKGTQQVYVLLFATFNCLGRMLCGFGSEWLLHRYALSRTAVLLSMSASTAVIYALIAFSDLRLLLACSILAGLAFGAHWALMPSCTSDLFGPSHFAANQSIIHLSTAVGALLLSTELAGTLFQQHGEAHGDPRGACFGTDCFRETFLVIAALALVQTGLSLILLLRSRPVYWQLHARIRRLSAETHL